MRIDMDPNLSLSPGPSGLTPTVRSYPVNRL
jgi:hypothetical protein